MTERPTFEEYQQRTEKTAIYPGFESDEFLDEEAIQYLALGLAGEAGEVAEKVKKWRREGDEEYLVQLQDELGDTLWYLARLADEAHLDLDYIAIRNLEKLKTRQENDVLEGEGDDR